jgi:hypothetical protein
MKEGQDGCRPLEIETRDLKVNVGCGIVATRKTMGSTSARA